MTRVLRLVRRLPWWAAGLLAFVSLAGATAALAAQSDPAPDLTWIDTPADQPVAWTDEIPAHIAAAEGDAWHERDGVAEAVAVNTPLLAGDRIRTQRGRVEIRFADGSLLDVDEDTNVELTASDLARLQAGRIRLLIARGTDSDLEYRVDAAGGIAWLRTPGEYQIASGRPFAAPEEVRLTVIRGLAELESAGQRTLVRAGSESVARAGVPPVYPFTASATSWDGFGRWIEAQHDVRVSYRSAEYLPDEIRTYSGVLDDAGNWEYDTTYGYVWYPTVSVGWRPYYDGRWSFVGSYGWFWIGAERWSWPTHHYGRWGWRSGRWYWIPGRTWGPAWVSWASAPGYVSWCPLGFDNRPVIALHVSTYTTWGAWTVIPSRSFAVNVVVRRHAIDGRSWSHGRNLTFVTHRTGPQWGGSARRVHVSRPLAPPTGQRRAVARDSWGTRAVTSAGAPRAVGPGGRTVAPSASSAESPRGVSSRADRRGSIASRPDTARSRTGVRVVPSDGRVVSGSTRVAPGSTRVIPAPSAGSDTREPSAPRATTSQERTRVRPSRSRDTSEPTPARPTTPTRTVRPRSSAPEPAAPPPSAAPDRGGRRSPSAREAPRARPDREASRPAAPDRRTGGAPSRAPGGSYSRPSGGSAPRTRTAPPASRNAPSSQDGGSRATPRARGR